MSFSILCKAAPRHLAACVPVVAVVALAGCVFRSVAVEPVEPGTEYTVQTPVRAHLHDGHTVVFRKGVRVADGMVRGTGRRYDLTGHDAGSISALPLDSIVGMESFRNRTNAGKTIIYSTLGTVATAAAVTAAAVAIFGSCPTVYTDSAGTAYLESETFSYSIAPIFEGRDVDRLRVKPSERGEVRLEVRNEALETHYINHLSLLEVVHESGSVAVPDINGRPLILRGSLPPVRAIDRAGRDLAETLAWRDGVSFRSDPGALAAAVDREPVTDQQLRDAIELELDVPLGSVDVGLVFTLRNSLFSTVLFYDVMLGKQGARALDWLGSDLGEIGPATELGLWAVENLGLRIEVWDGAWKLVGRIADTGPIAWEDVAVILPAKGKGTLRVRLTFPIDSWRIDRVAAYADAVPGIGRHIDLARVVNADGKAHASAVGDLTAVDDRYLVTTPGQRFFAGFDVGRVPKDVSRTYFLVSHGYYTEWIRSGWIADAAVLETFVPGRAALLEALKRWRTVQADMESRFFASRIPVH